MVSIIVPVYNSAEYLSTCVESILKQTYSNIELLLVDDCSADDSFKVMLEYAEKDSRIRCFKTEKNSGPSVARNLGIDNVQGEWISFVDSDDWIEEKYIEKLLAAANDCGADIAICGLINHYPKKNVIEHSFEGKIRTFQDEKLKEIRKALLELRTETGTSGLELTGPVCKLFLKEMIGEKRFPEDISICEDVCFVLECIDSCKRVVYIGECMYRRIVREDSLSYAVREDYAARRVCFVNKMIKYLHEHDYAERVVNQFVYLNLKNVVNYYVPLDFRKRQKNWIKYIDEYVYGIYYHLDFSKVYDIRQLRDLLEAEHYILYKLAFNIYLKTGAIK